MRDLFGLWIITSLAWIWISSQIFAVLSILILIDFVTWVIKSIMSRNTRSRCAVRWIITKGIVLIIPLSLWLLGKVIEIDTEMLLTWIFWAIALSEVYSILWNVYTIRTGNEFTEFDAVSIIIITLNDYIKRILDKYLWNKII